MAKEKTYLSKPWLDAWKEACALTSPAKIVIPKGIYFLSIATLEGPCTAPSELQVEGTEFSTAREPLLIKGKVAKSMIIVIHFLFKQFHVNVLGCKNITFGHFTVSAPGESPNTDGIHIGRSDEVNVLNTEIKIGDDCVLMGDGSKNFVINGVTCGPGHGISIGSLGLFKNEEPVHGVIEESKVKLSNINFKNIHGTSALPEAIKIICSTTLPCENVELANIEITHSGPTRPAVSQCLNVKP
ncbi:hypothetical protein Gogos_021200, partial [Gossypium gossypioides]|nr:hypothetical protein [Gossypium gossypioides]